MSITSPVDGWDRNARRLLLRRIFEGSPDKSVDYAPDNGGALTIQLGTILRNHAGLWAQDMREQLGMGQAHTSDADHGRVAWLQRMREADAEIKRYLAGPTFKPGAAA